MTTATQLPDDPFTDLAAPALQQEAAQIAQETFSQLFRLSAGTEAEQADDDHLRKQLLAVEDAVRNWLSDAPDADTHAARLAMLLVGLDQWGVAWSQAFGLQAIPALSALLGSLRTGLDAQQDAQVQQLFDAINHEEATAIDFKITLRRSLHLALWHAMIACESLEAAEPILKQLGSMWLALIQHSRVFGWRLVADAVAHIQIRCLTEGLAQDGAENPTAQASTQALFAALRQAVGEDLHKQIMGHAAQVLIAWQQQKRKTSH